MGERKVLNKYIPADFDPSLVPRGKKLSSKDGTVPVRMMLPFSIQCSTCHTFMYRGRKFNSKKEAMGGAEGTYLGITRWRFYIKCTHCSRPISFLTDPKNADYEMESGASRNYEVYKDQSKTEEAAAQEKEQEEKDDPMKALENRVLDSQREMAELDNLEEIKAMNRRHVQLLAGSDGSFDADARAVLRARMAKDEKEELQQVLLTEEDEALVKSIQFGKDKKVRRLDQEDELREEARRKKEAAQLEKNQLEIQQKVVTAKARVAPIIKTKRKRVERPAAAPVKKAKEEAPQKEDSGGGLAGLLGGYGSDSDSD